jgi:flagellar protein FliO/FliZ
MMKLVAIAIYCLMAIPSWGAESATTGGIAESDIPVQLESQKKGADAPNMMFRIVGSIAIVGLMGTAAVFYIRKYRLQNVDSATMPTIKVLSQHHLGPKKSLALVRVAGESILIGVTDQNINLIKSLSLLDEDIPSDIPVKFDQTLAVAEKAPMSDEEFSMSGIKDFVSTRLKNMRSI